MSIKALICSGCGNALTDNERHYYIHRCETCERKHWERIRAWREGAEDKELDRMFGVPRTIQ